MATMNSTSLYITANQIILQSDPNNLSTWQDLYRLVPDLRNSLCCAVCGNLLIDPQTPTIGKCQHHLCRKCKGRKKKVKPACVWCNGCKNYSENKTLKMLLQCYKKMCIMLISSGIFGRLLKQASQSNMESDRAGNLIMLIKEGAAFQDDYQINEGLSKSVCSSLPCIYTNSSTQTLQLNQTDKTRSILNSNLGNVTSGKSLHSVTYAGSGNKFTIERKPKKSTTDNKMFISSPATTDCLHESVYKKPFNISILKTNQTHEILLNSNLHNVTSDQSYAASDNKLTIERKPKESTTDNKTSIISPARMDFLNKSVFKKLRNKRISKTHQTDKARSILLNSNVTSGNSYTASDNKFTIERKPKQSTTDNNILISSPETTDCLNESVYKKPFNISILKTNQTHEILLNSNLHNVTSDDSYAVSENKLTIERTTKESTTDNKTSIMSPATMDFLNKSVYKKPFNISILKTNQTHEILLNSNLHNITSDNSYAASDSKLTIERTPKESTTDNKTSIMSPATTDFLNKSVFKKSKECFAKLRPDCNCGRKATVTLGKLTCFGQRCPCYTERKPCIKCKCRGCRNPYRPDGSKVQRHTPHHDIFQPATLAVSGQEQQLQLQEPLLQNVNMELVPTPTTEPLNEHLMVANITVLNSYTTTPTSLPHALLVNDGETTDNEDKEITLDF